MDPVCLHHDMSGLGGWEGIGWNRVGVRVVGYEIRFYYCVRLLSFVFFMNNLTKFFVTLFNISSTKKLFMVTIIHR